MATIDVILPDRKPRRWQAEVVARLERAGHRVRPRTAPTDAPWPTYAELLLAAEQRAHSRRRSAPLWAAVSSLPVTDDGVPADLTLDLAGGAPAGRGSTLRLLFAGSPSPGAALALLAAGRLPDLAAVCADGTVVGTAAPMVDSRALPGRALDDVLARAVTLIVATAGRVLDGEIAVGSSHRLATPMPVPPLAGSLAGSAFPRLARETWRRMRHRHAHWRVGYRFAEGEGVAADFRLGSGWTELPDDSTRFYADPFVFSHGDTTALLVEDYPHATGKAVISVATLNGRSFNTPRPVLEEPFHLSYPQVFARDGEIWMIPESVGARSVLLYRAQRFPDRWVREAPLIPDRELSDATLLDHGGRLWLFATDRDGEGSTSDTLVVYWAERLTGPWTPHRQNPIRIDRRSARPGGGFVRAGEGLVLPVQDGTLGYGGGLGFSRLHRLDEECVDLGDPQPLDPAGDWPHPQVHTYNRHGSIEVIDGIVPMPRRQTSRAS